MNNGMVKVGSHEVREIEWKGQRVITTAQLAEVYETSMDNVRVNFNNNKDKFQMGKHYFLLKGEALREFKHCVNDIYAVKPSTRQLYLWTHRGASRHCKILDTEKAWEQFDNLEEAYFNSKATQTTITYQYPISPAALEGATNAGRLFERIMKREGIPPHEIAMAVRTIFLQAGIDVAEYVVRIPAYEQLSLDVVMR